MKKILIIEDELPIAELEKDYLELSDFEVTIETDGKEGAKKAMTGDYDLLILDVMLPGEDGFKICQKFREKYLAPVIMVSAKKEDSDKIHGLGLGADDYMTKPFSPSELVARVKAHLNRYEALTDKTVEPESENEIIETGGLKIDKTARRVFVRGEEKTFTMKEFDLLYYFVKHPDTVLSKEELFEKIWGLASIGGDIATVTVHIKKIREKIEEDSSNPRYIETMWGMGYRFNTLS
jgi:DNA-binding response OmpR family regulator